MVGVSQPRYSRIERGEQQPSPAEAIDIAKFLGHPIQELLEPAYLVSKTERDFLDAVESERSIISSSKEIELSMKANGGMDLAEFKRWKREFLRNVRKERRRRETDLPAINVDA